MRILIAEDDPVSRLILQSAVEQFNHECLVADDGHGAWTLLLSEPVDVVISDRIMPGLDGLELCRRVREQTWDGYR
jgi:two-component system cell cycle response regulator